MPIRCPTNRARPMILLLGAVGLLAACGSSSLSPSQPSTTSTSAHLQPSPLGEAQCGASVFSDRSVYAQVALENTNCGVVASVASGADKGAGAPYTSHGFACIARLEGSGSVWAAYWGGAFYAYSCGNGSAQVAFNWGRDYTYGQSTTTSTPPSTSSSGKLLPSALGEAQCHAAPFSDGSTYAQVALANTTCEIAVSVVAGAATSKGAPYTSQGFACTATPEGSGSTWATAWDGTYYAYSCVNGNEQVAFNWGAHYSY
jgi:hypothetical protein